MSGHASWPGYLSSLGDELHVQARRVRQLIGDRHWLSDGHHKESLLRVLLRRHLPIGVVASRGFVIHPTLPKRVSCEQDILLVDKGLEAPIFDQSELAITFPSNVLGAISVKTRLDAGTVKDSINGLNSVRVVARDLVPQHRIWCSAFFYQASDAVQSSPQRVYDYIAAGLAEATVPAAVIASEPEPAWPNVVCSTSGLVFLLAASSEASQVRVRGFDCGDLATAVYLADLLGHLASQRGGQDPDIGRVLDQQLAQQLDPPERSVDLAS